MLHVWECWATVFCHLNKERWVSLVEGGLLRPAEVLNSWTGVLVPLAQKRLAGPLSTCWPTEQRKLIPLCLEVLVHDLPLVISSCLEEHLHVLLLCCTDGMRLFSSVVLANSFHTTSALGSLVDLGELAVVLPESLLVQTKLLHTCLEWGRKCEDSLPEKCHRISLHSFEF